MSTRRFASIAPGLLIAALLATGTTAGEPSQRASETLADFQRAWEPLTGRQYMRPLDDASWKARLEALQKLARAGDGAAPLLTDALKKGDDVIRVFATQALSLLPNLAAKASLVEALQDKNPAVRLYALDGLSMFGKLAEKEPYQSLREKDPNRDVRSHAAFALERDDKPQPEAIRRALLDYNVKRMATATVGENAPDFALTSAAGKEVRLSDCRGKKPVVLVFVYGDT